MGADNELEAMFQATLARVAPHLALLDRLTKDQFDVVTGGEAPRRAFLPTDGGRTWMLAMYAPKPGHQPKYRLRCGSLAQHNADQLRLALDRAGIPGEISTKNQKFAEDHGVAIMRPVWRVDLAPEVWELLKEPKVRLARQHLTEIRSFAILEHLAASFWRRLGPDAAVPALQNTDEGGYRLTVAVLAEALCFEKALEAGGVEFTAHDVGSARVIEFLPAFVDRLMQDPSLVQRTRSGIDALASRYLRTAGVPRHAPSLPETLSTTETYLGHRASFSSPFRH